MDDLEIMGASLYWTEGRKARVDKRGWKQFRVCFTNTNPEIITAFLKFLRKIGAKENKIKILIHLYPEHDIEKEINFWSKITKVPKNQFWKPCFQKGRVKEKNPSMEYVRYSMTAKKCS